MGLFIEDLLNLGNLIDAELEIELSSQILKKAYTELEFEINDGLMTVRGKKKGLILKKTYEVRLAEETNKVKKDKETGRQYAGFRLLTRSGLEELLKREGFYLEGDWLFFDLMPAVVLTETYQKVPKQFKDRLLINRYRLGKGVLKAFFKFEKG